MKDFNEIKTIERKLVYSQSAFFNMLRDVDPTNRELRKLYESIIFAFINAIDAKSPFTKGHSKRVTHYATVIAQEMGLTRNEVYNLRIAALRIARHPIFTGAVILPNWNL